MLNLDTHILIFALAGQLRPREKLLLAKERWGISAIVLLEIAKLFELGRIDEAARLWQEFLYSDQGQLLWLKGYSHPALFQDLAARKVIPKALLTALPAATNYAGVKFANRKQIADARARITSEWPAKVGS